MQQQQWLHSVLRDVLNVALTARHHGKQEHRGKSHTCARHQEAGGGGMTKNGAIALALSAALELDLEPFQP